MKLQFKHQKFQADAAKAVVDVFTGQPYLTPTYMMDRGYGQQTVTDDADFTGWRNERIVPELSDNSILEHLQNVQRTNQIKPSDKLEGRYNLTIEMETGVGKTYTYIKTMYELNKHYGWSKFIVVVPSIAIREGVYKSFQVTQEHFAEEYGKKIRFFIYNSAQLTEIDRFASDSSINVMIINSQAFNAKGKDARRIYMKLDEFRSRRPIDIIAKTNPILIIDEPQSVEGKQTKERLKEFNPLLTLRYSATHKADSIYNMVYRLDAMEAYNKRLVKKIAVKGITESGSTATEGFVYLESINLSKADPTATIQFDYKGASGIRKKTATVGIGYNLYDNSGNLDEYKVGFVVKSIDGRDNSVEFLNGVKIFAGDVIGKVSEDQIRRIQIRETILSHLERERQLYDTDIFTEPTIKGKLGTNAMKAQRHLYDHIVYDSTNERDFATDLDTTTDLWPLTTENIAETPPDVIGEVLERREENQKEFLLANGVRQVVIYPAAVHYQKDGQWKDIDNRLLPAATRDGETVYQNVAGMWNVSVPAELNTAGGITVSRNGYSLSFYLTGQLFEDGGAISESGSASMGEELPGEDMICVPTGESTAAISSTASTLADDGQLQPEAALKNQRSEAVYQNVYHDTDVTYDLDSNRLKESLILRSCPKEMLGYRYRLETDSLRLELQEDNRILAYAKDAGPQDEPVFYMPAPYLLDAENAYSNDIKVTLEENDKGYELRYYLPQDWMATAAYPVILDPVVQPVSNTFTIRDKTVTQRNPPAYDAISLDAGYSTNRGRERIYIRFKNIPSLTSADVVVGAKVLLYKYSGSGSISGNYMTAHQVKSMWDSETITWANRADYVHTSEDYQFVAGQTWHSWDITNIAQKWYEPSGNTGVMLRMSEAVEGGTTTKTASFYSSDYSNTQQCPMLVISYINNCGLESTWDYTSSSAGRAGTGYVNDYTGNLVWVHTGLQSDARQHQRCL